ncbi:hypothetical protein RFI_18701, partial [Reticulomyxa filosa]
LITNKKLEPSLCSIFDCVNGLKGFLTLGKELLLLHELEENGVWKKLLKSDYEVGLSEFVTHFANVHSDFRKQLFENIVIFFKKHYVGQINSATVVLAALVGRCKDDTEFLTAIITHLLPRCTYKEARVRKQALIGLANLKDSYTDELESKAPAILSCLTSAIEDQDEDVAAQGLRSLTAILDVFSIKTVQPTLINIIFRTKPFMDSTSDGMREGSFALFGGLTRFGVDDYSHNFVEQIHSNMVGLICHSNDPNDAVSQASMDAFKKIAAYLNNQSLIDALNESGIGKANYLSLISKLAPILVVDFKDNMTTYLHAVISYMDSRWGEIKGNSVLLAAKLIQALPVETRQTLDVDAVVAEILKQLSSKSARVRQRTAKALSFLTKI